MIYEYIIKKAKITVNGAVFPEGKNETELFNEMGRRGFHYVGFHPAQVIGFGRVNAVSLVFERCRRDGVVCREQDWNLE